MNCARYGGGKDPNWQPVGTFALVRAIVSGGQMNEMGG